MNKEDREIKITGVVKDEIAIDPNKADYWVVPFKLSSNPDEFWQKKFYEVYQRNTNAMKRRAHVNEDLLRLEVSSTDDLQKVLDVLKIEIAETNVLCEEDYQRKIEIRKKLDDLQKKQRDATIQFKEDSDNLIF